MRRLLLWSGILLGGFVLFVVGAFVVVIMMANRPTHATADTANLLKQSESPSCDKTRMEQERADSQPVRGNGLTRAEFGNGLLLSETYAKCAETVGQMLVALGATSGPAFEAGEAQLLGYDHNAIIAWRDAAIGALASPDSSLASNECPRAIPDSEHFLGLMSDLARLHDDSRSTIELLVSDTVNKISTAWTEHCRGRVSPPRSTQTLSVGSASERVAHTCLMSASYTTAGIKLFGAVFSEQGIQVTAYLIPFDAADALSTYSRLDPAGAKSILSGHRELEYKPSNSVAFGLSSGPFVYNGISYAGKVGSIAVESDHRCTTIGI